MDTTTAPAELVHTLEFHFDIYWTARDGWHNDTGEAFSDGPVWNGDDWTHIPADQMDTYLQRDSELCDALADLNVNLPPSKTDIELHYVLAWSPADGWFYTDVEPSGNGCLYDGDSWSRVTLRWEDQDEANYDTLCATLDRLNAGS